MDIFLDLHSLNGFSEQISQQVRQQIVTHKIKPGDKLPTVRELADKLKVNFNTVARAYRILARTGLIVSHQRRGSYILDRPELDDHLRLEALDALSVHYLEEVAELGFHKNIAIENLMKFFDP